MDERKYSLRRIIDELMTKYYPNDSVEFRQRTRETLRKKIKSIAKSTNINGVCIWQRATVWPAGHKKEEHIFTSTEKMRLLESQELKNYLLKTAQPEIYQEQNRLQKKAEELNEEDRDYFDALADEQARTGALNDGIYGPTAEQIRVKKLEIMIEALFLEIFTPIDEEQLVADLTAVYVADGTGDHTPMDVAAMERLQNSANYYKRKPKIQK